jgi:flavin-binding protein dodecin
MPGSIYKIIQLVGTSPVSWEEAAKNVAETASKSLKDLRIGEVTKLDMKIEDGKVTAYRARLNVSFKYHYEDK